jgi:hypothetical protein
MLRSVLPALVALVAGGPAAAFDEGRLLRFPAVHGDRIVFT